MAKSLGDQFLKAGLVNRNQLAKAKKSKHKQKKAENRKAGEVVSEAAESARQVAAEKVARDRDLNLRRKEEVERKAVQAQVRQLIELNRLPRDQGETGYNFQDGAAVKKIFVSEDVHDKLARGLLAIVRLDAGYEIVPSVVAEKIRLRDAACVVSNAVAQRDSEEDDPYADYQVPDDLMW